MYFTMGQLKAAAARLHDAGRTPAAGETTAFWCDEPRRDADGETGWMNEVAGKRVEYGPHGVGYLQINPATGEIRCAACAGEADATAEPKTPRVVKNRVHFVSQ